MADGEDRILGLAARRREERRAVDEAGGGVSEGFELAERELVDHASHGDDGQCGQRHELAVHLCPPDGDAQMVMVR